MKKTLVRLLAATTLALGAVPAVASMASADVVPLGLGTCNLGEGIQPIASDRLVGPADVFPGDGGQVAIFRGISTGSRCINVSVDGSKLLDRLDQATLELTYVVDGVRRTDELTFARSSAPTLMAASVVVQGGTATLNDVRASVRMPRTTLVDAPYTEQVACATVGVRQVERQVVRSVPTVVDVVSTVTHKVTPADRYAARSALAQENREDRRTYLGAARRAAARGDASRAKQLRARYAKARAANVDAYEKATAPHRVQVTTQKVVYRDTPVTEQVNETYDKTGECTVSGTRLTRVTGVQTYASQVLFPA